MEALKIGLVFQVTSILVLDRRHYAFYGFMNDPVQFGVGHLSVHMDILPHVFPPQTDDRNLASVWQSFCQLP
jgi:hypothetical protein